MLKKIKVLWVTTIGISITAYTLAFKSVIVYPFFNYVPFRILLLSSVIGIVYGFLKKCKLYIITFSLIGYIFLGFILSLLLWIVNPREFHEEFISPNGLKTIVVEYENEGRPIVYKKINKFFMKKIKTPNFLRSLEVFKYKVNWLSNNEILLLGPDGYEYKIRVL